MHIGGTVLTVYSQMELVVLKLDAFDHLGNVKQFKGITKRITL